MKTIEQQAADLLRRIYTNPSCATRQYELADALRKFLSTEEED